MIGGAVGYKKGGGLRRLFKNSGWKCDCKTTSQDSSSKSAPETAPAEHLTGKSSRPNARKSNATVTAPKSSSDGFKRSVAQSDINDATLKGKYLINDDFELVSANGAHTIIIRTKRGADDLPEHINNEMFITKINNTDIKVNKLSMFYELLEDKQFYDKPVLLTVARGGAGGSGDKQIKVRVILKRDISRQVDLGGGGKKTTYRRKKHVTQRKINTKRINVMVGGKTIKEVTCTCTKEDKKAPRRNKISPTPPSAEESNL